MSLFRFPSVSFYLAATSYPGNLIGTGGETNFSAARIKITAIPEPAGTSLLGLPGLAMIFLRRRQ